MEANGFVSVNPRNGSDAGRNAELTRSLAFGGELMVGKGHAGLTFGPRWAAHRAHGPPDSLPSSALRDQRVVLSRTALENGDVLKRPRLGDDFPVRIAFEDGLGRPEIGLVIRAKIKASALPCPLRGLPQKLRLHESILVMPSFRPGVGKQDIQGRNGHLGRQRIEKVPGFRVEEVEIGQFGTVALPDGAIDPLSTDVDPDAQSIRVHGAKGGEEVAMAAADFADKIGGIWQDASNRRL